MMYNYILIYFKSWDIMWSDMYGYDQTYMYWIWYVSLFVQTSVAKKWLSLISVFHIDELLQERRNSSA